MPRLMWTLLFCLLIAVSTTVATAGDDVPTVELIAVSADGARHVIEAEIADTNEAHAYGLMNRTEMPENHGMLFVFPDDGLRGFWMRNTFIPLDMLFIKADGQIHHIHQNAVPLDESPVSSKGSVRYVLELNGGMAKKWGLKDGDIIYNEVYFSNKLAE